jgi:hypothetical protein
MANSVGGRFPFIDPNVIHLANALPACSKLCGGLCIPNNNRLVQLNIDM